MPKTVPYPPPITLHFTQCWTGSFNFQQAERSYHPRKEGIALLLTMLVSWSVMLLAAVVRGVYCLSRDLVLVALAQNSWEISILSNRFKSHILFLFLFVLKCSLIECEHLKWLREITSNQGLNLFSDVLPSSVSTLVSIKRWGLYNVQCTMYWAGLCGKRGDWNLRRGRFLKQKGK